MTEIGNYAFNGSGISSLDLSATELSSIGDFCFGGCSSLTTIDLPSSISYIGNGAFYYCVGLKEIVCRAIKVPDLYVDTFTGTNPDEITLYVYEQVIEDYKIAPVWSMFGAILPIEEITGINSLLDETLSINHCKVYTLDGRCVKMTGKDIEPYTLPKGIYIINGKKVVVK